MFQAIYEISRFATLATMAELGVADHLAEGAVELNELARHCGAHAPSLRRVLRELAGMGYSFREKGSWCRGAFAIAREHRSAR